MYVCVYVFNLWANSVSKLWCLVLLNKMHKDLALLRNDEGGCILMINLSAHNHNIAPSSSVLSENVADIYLATISYNTKFNEAKCKNHLNSHSIVCSINIHTTPDSVMTHSTELLHQTSFASDVCLLFTRVQRYQPIQNATNRFTCDFCSAFSFGLWLRFNNLISILSILEYEPITSTWIQADFAIYLTRRDFSYLFHTKASIFR